MTNKKIDLTKGSESTIIDRQGEEQSTKQRKIVIDSPFITVKD